MTVSVENKMDTSAISPTGKSPKRKKRKQPPAESPAADQKSVPAKKKSKKTKMTPSEVFRKKIAPLSADKDQDNGGGDSPEVDPDPADLYEDPDNFIVSLEKPEGTEANDSTVYSTLNAVKAKAKGKVARVLPQWLAQPDIVNASITSGALPFSHVSQLSNLMIDKLKDQGFTSLYPVQHQLMPVLLDTCAHGLTVGRGGLRPPDICCSAPTGSGKTVAYVVPIVQALMSRVVCQVRALVILPVKDLAVQVYKTFVTFTRSTNLKVCLVAGQKSLASEQASLVKTGPFGYEMLADILVATPGRLVDHVNHTPGFNLADLRFLVMDEADRLIDDIKQGWVTQVENAVKKYQTPPATLTPYRTPCTYRFCQKLLFSATLSQNPEKLEQLNLFQPRLFTSFAPADTKSSGGKTPKQAKGEESSFIGKYSTPDNLKEFYVECAKDKPLVLLHLLSSYKNILCFTNSIEATNRLCHLVGLYGGVKVEQFSSSLSTSQRAKVLKRFSAGKIKLLISSDAMARGMDIQQVDCVISYDCPTYVKTYIHRVGRTARGGAEGVSVTLVSSAQMASFRGMMKIAGKTSSVHKLEVSSDNLSPLMDRYKMALKKLPEVLKKK